MSENIQTPKAHEVLWDAFSDFEYRRGFAEGHAADFLANQIHTLRVDRGLNQKQLAKAANVTQPQISNWEASCDGITLTSLNKLAEAFDVALIAKFVPFSEAARELFFVRSSAPIASFEDDSIEAIRRSLISISMPQMRPNSKKGTSHVTQTKTYYSESAQTFAAL